VSWADLNGDGLVTLMRVRDPEGDMMPDRRPARAAAGGPGESGARRLPKVMVEGIDPDNVDAYVPWARTA
jgi:hypothetical protein